MDYREAARAIKALKIQGAHRIAITGAKSLLSCNSVKEVKSAIRLLAEARLTEPFLRNAIAYVGKDLKNSSLKKQISEKLKFVEAYFEKAKKKVEEYGSRRIHNGSIVYTHCHSSTVIGVLLKAKKAGRKFSVHNTETRPFFQGRLTAKELSNAGIKVVHYVDSAARQAVKKADIMLIGCDAITSDGFVINKIGSEMFSELANNYEIPVYVCTVSWKYDSRTRFGFDEAIEKRFSSEVWQRPPKGVEISNSVFEKIHPRLITGIISEFGILKVEGFLEAINRNFPLL